MIYAHALREWAWPYAHIKVTTINGFAQIVLWVPACLVWLYYAPSYTVALFPGPIPSFAVMSTEKLAFQYATLQSWE